MSPVAHWTADQTSSDGTPVVLRPDAFPSPGGPSPSGQPSHLDPPRPPSHPTQGGLPSSRSFLSEPEATVQTTPGGDALQSPNDAPATLPIGSMSSIAHAPLVATRPSPFDSLVPAAPSPQAQPAPQPWRPPGASPSPPHHTLSTALPPRHAAPWPNAPQPQPTPAEPTSRATTVLLLAGLVIVSVLVMVTLVVAVVAARR